MKSFVALIICVLIASVAYAAKISGSAPVSATATFDGGTISTTGITIPETASGSDIGLTIPALTSGRGPMLLDFRESTFDGAQDPIWAWGYNTKSTGQPSVTGEPGFNVAIEGHYQITGVGHIEHYSSYTYNDGLNYFRPYFYMVNKSTHRLVGSVHLGNPFYIQDDLGNASMRIYPSYVYFDSLASELNVMRYTSTLGVGLESSITPTAGNDRGFSFKVNSAFATDNNSTDDRLVNFANGATDVFGFRAGGRLLIYGAANNGQPGVYVSTPNGRGMHLRTAGGSGEMILMTSLNSNTTAFVFGGQATTGVMYLGPSADVGAASTELTLDGSTSTATFKSGWALKVGSNTVPTKVAAPASASSTCTTGQVAFDSSYAYFCTATNTWHRAAIATW